MGIVWDIDMLRLWFNFKLGSNFISLCFKLIMIHYHALKHKGIKFKPNIKLDHNIDSLLIQSAFS